MLLYLFLPGKTSGAFEERLLSARASAMGGLYSAHSSSLGLILANSVMFKVSATLYNTDSFDSRIYIYEHDFPGVLRNTAVYSEGYRFMVLASKDISTYFSASVKLERYSRNAQNKSTDETRIGIQFDSSI